MSYLFETPLKMPRGTHYGSDYWIAYSYKLKRMVHLYSMLEYANFITLEMNPAVEFFCEQPYRIESQGGVKTSSVFDFWVQYKEGHSEFQEVKYSSELTGSSDADKRSQEQIAFQREWCQKNGYGYQVVTEKDLYDGSFAFQNLKSLHNHMLRYSQVGTYDARVLYGLLNRQKKLTLGELKEFKALPEKYELAILAYQFYLGKILINLKDRPIDNSTEVMVCETKNIIS